MGIVHIHTSSSKPFQDRYEAGQYLAGELSELSNRRAVVLGIPRGGIIIAREIALALGADLDVVLSRKLRTPGHPELALGSVAEDGKIFLNQSLVSELAVSGPYIQQEKEHQLAEMARRRELIRAVFPKVPVKGRVAVVTDDGVATGATFQAALWSVRQEHPETLVAAMPVGPPDTVHRLAEDADETICLRSPELFAAVGQFYNVFEQVTDEDVLKILQDFQQRKGTKGISANINA